MIPVLRVRASKLHDRAAPCPTRALGPGSPGSGRSRIRPGAAAAVLFSVTRWAGLISTGRSAPSSGCSPPSGSRPAASSAARSRRPPLASLAEARPDPPIEAASHEPSRSLTPLRHRRWRRAVLHSRTSGPATTSIRVTGLRFRSWKSTGWEAALTSCERCGAPRDQRSRFCGDAGSNSVSCRLPRHPPLPPPRLSHPRPQEADVRCRPSLLHPPVGLPPRPRSRLPPPEAARRRRPPAAVGGGAPPGRRRP